jgi:hypothetical protein
MDTAFIFVANFGAFIALVAPLVLSASGRLAHPARRQPVGDHLSVALQYALREKGPKSGEIRRSFNGFTDL